MTSARDILIIWAHGDWRCELHPAAEGEARLKIFRGKKLEVIKPTSLALAYERAEVLRHLFCGDLRAD